MPLKNTLLKIGINHILFPVLILRNGLFLKFTNETRLLIQRHLLYMPNRYTNQNILLFSYRFFLT